MTEQAQTQIKARQQRDYTTGSLNRNIWLLAVPMVLEMGLVSAFRLADMLWVGRLGPEALAAITIGEQLRWALSGMAMGQGIGGLAVVARRIGEKDHEAANYATMQAVLLALGLSILFSALGFALTEPLLILLGAEPAVMPLGMVFLWVTFGGLPGFLMVSIVNSLLRGAGEARLALFMQLLAYGLGLLVEPVLIFGWGPLPALGVAGAALALVGSQWVGFLCQLAVLFSGRARIRIDWRHLRIDPRLMWQIFGIAMPSTIQMTMRSLSRTILLGVVGMYGTFAVVAYGIAVRVFMTAFVPAFGLGNAAATLVGQNLGAQKPDRAARSAWIIAGYSLTFMFTCAVAFTIWAEPIVAAFNDTPGVVALGAQALRVFAVGYVFSAVGAVMARAFDGAGNTTPAMAINLLTLWGIQIPLAWVLSQTLGLGTLGLWLGISAANVANGVVFVFWFRRGRWKQRSV
ncbi:MAG: MATE family efflux transporter [Chloroflexi bacterium]|nr:MATE family efflux transporter [Chloroflexota bacterium]